MRLTRARRQATSASALLSRAIETGDVLTLSADIRRLTQAIGALPADDPERPGFIADLVRATWARWQANGAPVSLEAAVEARRMAVSSARADVPADKAAALNDLAYALQIRYEIGHRPPDADAAVTTATEAAGLLADDDALRPHVESLLCLALQSRYEVHGAGADLDAAVAAGEQAVRTMAADEADRELILRSFAQALMRRYELAGSADDLDRACGTVQQALDAVDINSPASPAVLIAQSNIRRLRAERTGSETDATAAVEAGHQAVAVTSAGGAARALALSTLGLALVRRFELTADRGDLDAAIEAGGQAVDAAGPADPGRLLYLSNLSGEFLRRAELTQATSDLDGAVSAARRAVEIAAGPVRPRALGNLSNALQAKFIRTREKADITAAAEAARTAVHEAGPHDANVASYLNSLSNSLQLQFSVTQTVGNLDEAISAGEQAVKVTNPLSPSYAIVVATLARALQAKAEHTRVAADFDAAVSTAEQAVLATPAGYFTKASCLNVLQAAQQARFSALGQPGDARAAIETGQQAVAIQLAPAGVRIQAALGWAEVAIATTDWAEAVRAYDTAASLLPDIAPRGMARSDQELQLAQLAGLGARAAACCLEAGDAEHAMELLEQGRGVLLSQVLATRELAGLAERDAALAKRFLLARGELDRLLEPASLVQAALSEDEAQRIERERRRLALELEAVAAQVRTLDGLERFMLAPSAADLVAASSAGPVVMLNISDIRCDALIVDDQRVRSIPLPAVSVETVRDQLTSFLTALDQLLKYAEPDAAAQAEADISAMLCWLWDAIAEPVLAELGLTGTPEQDAPWPRIWWCPGGMLSFLPVHAAGHHDTRFDLIPRTVIDRVISSYTPTLRALLHGRRPVPDGGSAAGRVLAIVMPHTDDVADLPGAPHEAETLRALFAPDILILNGSKDHGPSAATRKEVSSAMPSYPWAHFACHAAGRLDNPSATALLLRDYQSQPLTVLGIAGLNLEHAELAYLSACSTALTGATIPDEAISLASAFQVAGYRRVIATLWPVDDQIAVQIADRFYQYLARGGLADEAGAALHAATRRLRATRADQPSLWTAHIHSGT
jgi:tetratricopeptide (TPR) repeat protein